MEKHYDIFALGVSHRTAPIEIREKLAFLPDRIPAVLQELIDTFGLAGGMLLSTCNRTEIYGSGGGECCPSAIISWWQKYHSHAQKVEPYIYVYRDAWVAKHALRVASGLDSMILGEPQILGQLKTAFQIAQRCGTLDSKLSRLFQLSFSTAKKIRASTGIATYPVSVAFAAVTLSRTIFSDLSGITVVLIGAGQNTELLLQHLLAKQVRRIIIVNRTVARAKGLAERYQVEYTGLDGLVDALQQADMVVSSVAVDCPLIGKTQMEQAFRGVKRRPLLMVDLGVPRNIDPVLSQHEDIYLYSVDDLEAIIQKNKKHRALAAEAAEHIIVSMAERYMQWMRAAHGLRTIQQLRKNADKIKQDVLKKAYKQLAQGEQPNAVIERALHQLTQKLLHSPTIHLRHSLMECAEETVNIAKALFNLE